MCAGVNVRARVFACVFFFFCQCVQQSPNQIQQKVFVYSCFAPLWFTLILIPIWGLILGCCLGWDSNFSEAWQEGRKPLALLLACHWCMPLGTMCHILQLAHAAFFFFFFFFEKASKQCGANKGQQAGWHSWRIISTSRRSTREWLSYICSLEWGESLVGNLNRSFCSASNQLSIHCWQKTANLSNQEWYQCLPL